MKLKKREITLNEADSLKDVWRLEKTLWQEYAGGTDFVFRKETVNEVNALRKEAEKEVQLFFSLWEKSKAEQL